MAASVRRVGGMVKAWGGIELAAWKGSACFRGWLMDEKASFAQSDWGICGCIVVMMGGRRGVEWKGRVMGTKEGRCLFQ
jgi:hypothetical protein